jgi:plasmid stabilization system protein ParE
MGSYRLTRRAENDLLEIGEYTVRTCGARDPNFGELMP